MVRAQLFTLVCRLGSEPNCQDQDLQKFKFAERNGILIMHEFCKFWFRQQLQTHKIVRKFPEAIKTHIMVVCSAETVAHKHKR